ncbi:MAG: heavy-metal-associated domain-containing protein [Candidatus Cryptobacteroides sp.]
MRKIHIIAIALCAFFCAGRLAAAPVFVGNQAAEVKKIAYKTVTFNVSMHCQKCVRKINDNVSFEKGVKDLSVSLDRKTVTVTYDPSRTDASKIKAALEKLGYQVSENKAGAGK